LLCKNDRHYLSKVYCYARLASSWVSSYFLVSFSLAHNLFVHGIHPYECFAPAHAYKNRSYSNLGAVTDGTA